VDLGILTVGHQTYESWSQICISQVSPRKLLETASVEADSSMFKNTEDIILKTIIAKSF
jgi:hypothetical protein